MKKAKNKWDELPLAIRLGIDKACDRFRDSLRNDQNPCIEVFLVAEPDLDPDELFCKLLEEEVAWRLQNRTPLTQEEYCYRYPDKSALISLAFQNAESTVIEQKGDPASASTSSSGVGAGSRFRILKLHEGGGMGEVFVAEDQELHREVALKKIRKEYADNDKIRHRFLREAEITGRLEHPGIVAVYGLGQEDGRPFYAMRFIKGDNFKEAIERFHKAEIPGRDSSERTLAFRDLLGRFVDVCNAVAYAHSRGILHRDLKPGNIMLGKYGETLLVDWGLAKAVDRPENLADTEDAILRPGLSEGDMAVSHMGEAHGTPVFMSPEQAAGRLDLLCPASDIYSLGATLYVLLTGQAPFTDRDRQKVLRKVQQGDFVPPRQVKPGVPAALDAICRKAMALQREDRYQSALEVAADIEHWLADEPVTAWLEPATVKVGRWMRRNKALVASAAAALLVAILGGSGVGLWYVNDRAQRQAEETVRHAELDARQKQVNREVLAAMDEGETLFRGLHARLNDPKKVHVLLSRIQDWKAILDTAEQAQKRARGISAGQEGLLEPETAARLQAFSTKVEAETQNYRLGMELDTIRLEAATVVNGKFEPWKAGPKYAAFFPRLGIDIEADEPNQPAEAVMRSPLRYVLVAALDHWALTSILDGSTDGKLTFPLLNIARRADPDPWRDRFRSLKAGPVVAELKELTASVDLPRQSPQMAQFLAMRLKAQGLDSVSLLRSALLVYPADFWLHFTMSGHLKDPGEQAAHSLAALAVRPNSSAAYKNLGLALGELKKLPEAVAAFQKAIDFDSTDAMAYNNLGYALVELNKLPDAIAACQKAIELDPKLAGAYNNLGNALHGQHKLPEAITAYQKAIELDPNLAMAYNNLGNALRSQYKLPEAITACQKAIELDPKFAYAYYSLGVHLSDQNKLPEAITAYQKAIELDPKNTQAHNNLGLALHNTRKLPEAIAAFQKAIELDPKDAFAYNNLGLVLHEQKKLPEAIRAYQKAIELDPKLANAHGAMGLALARQGFFDQASDATQKALDLLPQGHPTRRFVEGNLQQCQHLLALEKRLPLVLAGKQPATADHLLQLASMCQEYKKRYTTAVHLYQSAFKAEPALANDWARQHRYNAACAAALAGCGQGDEAAKLREVERTKLRRQALDWLQADLDHFDKQIKAGNAEAVIQANKRLLHWQQDADFAGVRDVKELAKLSDEEKQTWQKLWTDVQKLHKGAQSRFTETRLQGTLTAKEASNIHAIKMTAGKTYHIDMESTVFDTFLKLEDAQGKLLAENDDISPANLNSRIVFSPKADGTYRIVATSFEQRGLGPYTLTIREFLGNK